MSEKLKYIKLPEYNSIVIFPCVINHSSFRHKNPVSAGFCNIDTENEVVKCYGESIGLDLKSNQEEDTKLATIQVFGTEAFINYINKLKNNP